MWRLRHKIGGIPVVEGEQVVGIITESDIFRVIVETLPELERAASTIEE
jgi:CBS domain-containing protein